ncbi:hypothetical protein IU443_08770 [Nocardia farcinica]|uniref:YbaB/EbfC DNA-binding family protein n=2 Tax=Nocardia farcinica TaxID=37329 RepID=Q5Z1N1_NOCFA|nr:MULTISPECIES: hypothetical protein [Nocardia]AXK86411.1 hypothetical protein DXT66_12940 [Nocardia farcinica]MBA4859597.1 hypothetical protein [Nocardia farcinica]MBC9818673.1 hypothetical protein [Nocardia farcinica]MBF6069400.1 hypothetical protein [Nocardia farcinica]MBF6138592.1 hypothetical protein [Nocardia farcinica]
MSEQQGPVEWTASSRDGSITVRTTEQGLPRGIAIEPAELRRDPADLAAQVLRLCKQAANRAGVARREQLTAAGMAPEMLALLGLPTQEQVAGQELADEEEYEDQPRSWLREV